MCAVQTNQPKPESAPSSLSHVGLRGIIHTFIRNEVCDLFFNNGKRVPTFPPFMTTLLQE
jgi:hypothetical protein